MEEIIWRLFFHHFYWSLRTVIYNLYMCIYIYKWFIRLGRCLQYCFYFNFAPSVFVFQCFFLLYLGLFKYFYYFVLISLWLSQLCITLLILAFIQMLIIFINKIICWSIFGVNIVPLLIGYFIFARLFLCLFPSWHFLLIFTSPFKPPFSQMLCFYDNIITITYPIFSTFYLLCVTL